MHTNFSEIVSSPKLGFKKMGAGRERLIRRELLPMHILAGLAEGQVLQRLGPKGATATLRGTGLEDGPIEATIFKGNVALKGWKKRHLGEIVWGKFNAALTAVPVGGPYRLRLDSGKQRTEIASFFVGDVWVLAGQSNMSGVGDRTGAAKSHPLLRAFSMRREWRLAEDTLHVTEESPDACHAPFQCPASVGEELRRNATKGVGVGVFFAREMLKRSGGVPQGLICTAHGGTSMQQWSPERKHLGGESLYASMLFSVQATGQPVSGLLWYQGESDANPQDSVLYTSRMKKLVAASRRDLRQPKLPWISVQIARLFKDPDNPLPWNSIQEQQRLLPEKIENFETVPAIDLPLDDCIHVGAEGFPRLAVRMASAAARLVYRDPRELRPPQLRSVRVVETSSAPLVEVAFDGIHGGLRAPGEPSGFQIVSPEGTPLDYIYQTDLKGDTATLRLCKKPTGPVHLFYGHGLAPSCNIADARGFSLPVFGPFPLGVSHPRAVMPYVTQWRVSEVVPAVKKLNAIAPPDLKALKTTVKSYPVSGMVNEHNVWASQSGHAFFHACLHLAEPMKLEFLMGYDGPFRLWVDEKPFFTDMSGTNPCLPDESRKAIRLEAGVHDLQVGMDLNNGRAFGFYLRLARVDVTKAQIRIGDYVKPAYTV